MLEKLEPTKLPLVQQQIWALIQEAHLTSDLDLRATFARDHGDHTHDWDDELTAEGVPVSLLLEMSGNEVAHFSRRPRRVFVRARHRTNPWTDSIRWAKCRACPIRCVP